MHLPPPADASATTATCRCICHLPKSTIPLTSQHFVVQNVTWTHIWKYIEGQSYYHWLNISSFSVKKLVKNVLNFIAIFQWKTKWKTWNLFMNFLNFKTFSALFQKIFTRFKKITKMFQVFHLLFWRKIAVKFKTFFTKIFSAKLEMFNQCLNNAPDAPEVTWNNYHKEFDVWGQKSRSVELGLSWAWPSLADNAGANSGKQKSKSTTPSKPVYFFWNGCNLQIDQWLDWG